MASTNGFRGDQTARRRRNAEDTLRDNREIVRRHVGCESIRQIARAIGLPKTAVHRVIQEYRAAQHRERPSWAAERSSEIDDAEFDALVQRYEGGIRADTKPDPALVAELAAAGVDVEAPETVRLLRAYTSTPNPLTLYRLQHAPMTAQWWQGRDKLGQLNA